MDHAVGDSLPRFWVGCKFPLRKPLSEIRSRHTDKTTSSSFPENILHSVFHFKMLMLRMAISYLLRRDLLAALTNLSAQLGWWASPSCLKQCVWAQTPSGKAARLTPGSPEGGSELPDTLLFWVTVDSQLDRTMV